MTIELQSRAPAPFLQAREPAPPPGLVEAMVLRHLKHLDQISSVLHLREEIDLSVHAASGRHFVELEKKETSAASCSASSSQVRL
jgi:hypothetical protein